MKVTVLGCGSSGGVPFINGFWGNCNPKNPKNNRLRASLCLEHNGKNILIDCSPDLRFQILRNTIKDIHAVLFTHAHADHCHGINDLCLMSRFKKQEIPLYGDKKTMEEIQKAFGYAFPKEENEKFYRPFVTARVFDEKPFEIEGLKIEHFEQDHGVSKSRTFKIGKFAYSTDVKTLTTEQLDSLKGLDVWVVDCLRDTPHLTHSHLDQTLEWIDYVKPKRAILTHMSLELDYDELMKNTPDNVEPAYDGLTFDII
jgi:phosphoribosyl 1,2-cyclic phosphate phosphodiesterase